MIFEALIVGFIATNCYIVASDKTRKGMIIDPGAESKAILKKIEDLKISVSLIVVTHSHFDHIGAVKSLKEATGARFAVGTGSEGATPGAFVKLVAAMSGGSARVPEPDLLLKDSDKIDIDDLHFEVLFTPGHSPDEISLYGHGILFSGDTLFNAGIGRTDFPGCSYKQLENSIKSKLYTLPDSTIVYPGHGPQTTIGDEKRGNPFIR
ncbi:MAG: MBL fold metallo-hydrolase [Dehalococcoidia bacterium]|jgi:glyoxylase-like metal-dependent hydrolase (beta-lactamase superfamily II)